MSLSSWKLEPSAFSFFSQLQRKTWRQQQRLPLGVLSWLPRVVYTDKFGDFRALSSTIVVQPPSSVAILTIRPPINVTIKQRWSSRTEKGTRGDTFRRQRGPVSRTCCGKRRMRYTRVSPIVVVVLLLLFPQFTTPTLVRWTVDL